MQVTDIIEISKSRSKVYLDREFAFVLYKGEFRLYNIKEGQEIEQETYDRIMTEVLPKRAKLRAMNLLMKKTYTTAQLRQKLEEGLYPEPVIEQALAYVASFHYTDDLQYAVDYITYHEETIGRRRIEQDLFRKGISAETVERAWMQWEELGGMQDEQAMMIRLLEKKGYHSKTADMNEKRRMYAFLMRKGFSSAQIGKVIHNYSEDA